MQHSPAPLSDEHRRDLQNELEYLSIDTGVRKYRAILAEGGHGAVSAGNHLIKAAVQPMEGALKEWLESTGRGFATKNAAAFKYIGHLDPTAVAWLTAQTTISMLHMRPSLATMATALATQLESAIGIDAIAAINKRLAEAVAKRAARKKHLDDRRAFIRKGAALAEASTEQWDPVLAAKIGSLLVTMFSQSTELVVIETIPAGGNRTNTIVRASESCLRWLEESHARCELLCPDRLPMVCKPRAWSSPFNGGYLSKGMRKPLIKTRSRGYLSEMKEWEMPEVYKAVNALQATEWSVNVPIFETIRALYEANYSGPCLPARENAPQPAKSWSEGETPAEDVLHAWKVDAARAHEANYKLTSKRLQLTQKLSTAEMMLERGNRFHFVYNMDWRGRMYPVGSGMNPQGDDIAKALLRFSNGVPLGEEGAFWLAVHGANCFGVDKVSFEDRIKWVEEHADAIWDCGMDPLDNPWWQDAENPFLFLAFCMEWRALQNHVDLTGHEDTFVSHLPVAFDGACNGLQNFSAMLRDPVGGAATGLVPGEKPADIYSEVAAATQAIIDRDATTVHPPLEVAKRWVGKMTRKLAKRNTMTVPYGVTQRGMRDQLFAELTDSLPEHRGEDASYLATCNHIAIGRVVVAARHAMDWLKEAAKVASGNKLPVKWETPMGLLVVQNYRVDVGEQVDFEVLGRRYRFVLEKAGDKLNTRKQALGISPNFVHSLDAAHLMRTVLFCVEDGMTDFAMIHDSYGCHAGHASLLRDNLRSAFVDQYTPNVLAKFRDELIEQLPPELAEKVPPLPPMGDLDLELVRQSDYFFA